MNDKEKNSVKNESKDGGFRFPFDCNNIKGTGMLEMMRQCCEGKTESPDCCAEMSKMWKKADGPSGKKGNSKK